MFKNKSKFITMIVLIVFKKSAFAANILFLCALPSPSHHLWNSVLANSLAAHGHNVTVASVDKDENPPERVHYIYFEGIYNNEDHEKLLKTLFVMHSEMNPLTEPIVYDSLWYDKCKVIFRTKGFQELLNYPDDFHFDVIIYDFTAGACLLGFMHKFNYPPLVSVTAYGNPSILNTFIGGHQFYSYIPHNYLVFDGEMNFWQRIYNFAVHLIEYYYHKKTFNKKFDELSVDTFGSDKLSAEKLEERTLIALVNTNPAFDYLAPLPENVIPVGGLHIQETKKLPQDLEDFIDASKKGTILFSLGTNVRSYLMDGMKRKIILDAFAQLPDYHFIWKFEKNITEFGLPKNVMVRPWLPQSDILAHPKIMAFFTHSGLLSTQESIWRGVPLIGMPFAYDQHRNLKKSIELGFAERVDFHSMNTAEIKEKLTKVLENPTYKKNVMILSKRFKDQKEKPIDRAVWWIEWVLRNPNADYMRSPVLRLGLIVGNAYDLIAFLTFIFIIIIFMIMKIIWTCTRLQKKTTKQLKTE